jgi:hypothetical protein
VSVGMLYLQITGKGVMCQDMNVTHRRSCYLDIPVLMKTVSRIFQIIVIDVQRLKFSKSSFQMPYNL